jgi:uncharacterized protein
MPEDVLERVVPDRVALGDRVKFIWHGGEPMLAGIEFFKRVMDLQDRFNRGNIKVVNAIQTNATLINQEWAEFFAKNDFKIGTSIDGPRRLHNISRNQSYDQVLRGIQHIHDTGRGVGIVLTINKYNADEAEAIWREIIEPKQISRSFEINVCSSTELSNLTPSFESSLNFLIKLFDLWLENDDPSIVIKTFRVVSRFILGGDAGDCAFEYNKCREFAAIDEKGDVYVCNRFMKRGAGYLGNIMKEDLRDILNSETAIRLHDQIARIKKECRNCEWLMCCGGGCAFQRWLYAGCFDAGFPECELRKKFFVHVKERLAQL